MEELKTIIDHTKNLYDLIDTSIKIGLSSIITGVITYKITNKNHSHEIKKMEKSLSIDFSKEKLNKKIQYFEESMEKIEPFFEALSELTSEWIKYENQKKFLKDIPSQEKELYIKKDDQYKTSKQYSYKVAHKLRLLGFEDILNTVQEIDSIINTKRSGIILDKHTFIQQPELKDLFKKINSLKNTYDNKVEKAFNSLF